MLDRRILDLTRSTLDAIAKKLVTAGIKTDHITCFGLAIGLGAVPLIATGHEIWAILFILANRLADGLDGSMARMTVATDRGAFLDIAFDFLFYSAIPLAFALANPQQNALAAATLIYAFIGTGSTFLAFAVIAAKRNISSNEHPGKGFFYLGGLTEATETILLFIAMCLLPQYFTTLAYAFAALCAITTITRIAAGIRAFKEPTR